MIYLCLYGVLYSKGGGGSDREKGDRDVEAEIFLCYSFHPTPIFHQINWLKKLTGSKKLNWFEKDKPEAKIKP